MRNLHQALTYWFGYRRGKRGIALKCPWWANCLVYAVAHMYGTTPISRPRQRPCNSGPEVRAEQLKPATD